ncbi:hypothetical protein ACGFY7_49900 [Streptomyces prunicolor]
MNDLRGPPTALGPPLDGADHSPQPDAASKRISDSATDVHRAR